MKKIAALAPIAILLGLPASSIAMEVELYGLIDTGFKYQNTDDLGVSGFLCLGRLFQGQPNEAALCI